MAFLAWISMAGMTIAFQMEKAGRVSPLNYIQVVLAWIFDVCFFGATVRWTDLVATFFIIGFTFLGAIYEAFFVK